MVMLSIFLDDSLVAHDSISRFFQWDMGYSNIAGGIGYDFGVQKFFDVKFSPDHVSAGEMAQINVQALDCRGLPVSAPAGWEMFLSQDCYPGDFVRDGNEILNIDIPIPYGDFQSGRISFKTIVPTDLVDDDSIQMVTNVYLDEYSRYEYVHPKGSGMLTVFRKGAACPFPEFAKSTIAQGETVQVLIRRKNSDGTFDFYPDGQRFDVMLLEGAQYGTLVDTISGVAGSEIPEAVNRIMFIASQSLDVDSVRAELAVYTSSFVQAIALKKKGRSPVPKLRVAGGCHLTASILLKQKFEILLGETKFYRAKIDPNDEAHLIIEESSMPILNDGIASTNVWGENPVVATAGEHLGVYWEKEKTLYPPWGDGVEKAQAGLIRLVGRYWDPDHSTKVMLTASGPNGSSGRIEIEVKKPKKLGDLHSMVIDVSGQKNNLDSLIILFAGANGIPPQLIKGQMEQETNFLPSWRYEPFQDASRSFTSEIFLNNKFLITETSLGENFPWPPKHSNIHPAYNQSQMNISKYLVDNWFHMYVGRGGALNVPDVILGSENAPFWLTRLWKEKWDSFGLKKSTKAAKDSAHKYVKNLITDPSTDIGRSFHRLAQTRIFTSYGATQLMYSMAITNGKFNIETHGQYGLTGEQYMDKTNSIRIPEMLSETATFMPRYCDWLLRNLSLLFQPKVKLIPSSQWWGERKSVRYSGFEENWMGSLLYFNTKRTYPAEVWSKSRHYYPQ